MSGTVPKCPTCKGVVKPDIVFFGEELPRHFFKYITDFPLADLLIIMGTSLEVSFKLRQETHYLHSEACKCLDFKSNNRNVIVQTFIQGFKQKRCVMNRRPV